MKRKLYLHIGIGKTGTSSIQSFLYKNCDVLKSNDILFPRTGLLEFAHHALSGLNTIKIDIKKINSAYENLINEINISNCKNIIISSEFFLFSPIDVIKKIKEVFSEFDISLLVYIRPQRSLIESAYLQSIKADPQYVTQIYGKSAINYFNWTKDSFDFNLRITPWLEAFGGSAINAFLFHPDIIGPNVVDHFIRVTNINSLLNSQQLIFDAEFSNLSIHPLLFEFVKKWDEQNQNVSQEKREIMIDHVLSLSKDIVFLKHSLYTSEQLNEIQNYFHESNRLFAESFLTAKEKELLLK